VKYHLETSHKEGITKEEMMEAMGITLVGGTIIPLYAGHMNLGSLRGRSGSNTSIK
jgi:alkylhydroperoxidase/carboxymuconolactone decarboxylase family protein YurZ